MARNGSKAPSNCQNNTDACKSKNSTQSSANDCGNCK